MLLLKCLLIITAWGLLAWAAAIALNNLDKVVQYHRRMRLHIAPEPGSSTRTSRGGVKDNSPVKPQPELDNCQMDRPRGLAPLILAKGIAVVPSGMGGIRVSQTSGTRPGTLHPACTEARRMR
jgi:hypothetical protein